MTKECFLWFSMEVPETGMKLLLISVFCFLMFLYIYYILQNIHFLTQKYFMLFTIKKKITRNERLIGLMVSYVLRPAGVSPSRMERGGMYPV